MHGTPQSGQEQDISRSRAYLGNNGVPHAANTSSISCGISPASSLARNSACAPSAAVTERHCAVVSGRTPIRTWYGAGREPCTRARTLPVVSSNSMTWPRRA